MRGRGAVIAAMIVAVAAAWYGSAELAWPARAWTALLLGVLPVAMLAQLRVAQELPDELPRLAVYLSSAVAIWVLAAVTVAIALISGFTIRLLGILPLGAPALLGWTIGATVAGLLVMIVARASGVRESRLLRHIIPVDARERLAFVGLSLSAGIGEELVFRGFLIPALTAASGSTILAVVLSSGIFGLVHAYQHGAGVARAALLGAVLAVPFVVTGSILPSMIAHTLLDVIAGLWLADWLLRR